MNVVVLGAGRVGAVMAADLAAESRFRVCAVDRDPTRLAAAARCGVATKVADLADAKAVRAATQDADFVVSAVPGFLGFATLRTLLEAGHRVVDIAFFPEDPFSLDALATSRGALAVIDCGVAPGMSNVLVARAAARLRSVHRVRIYVGGLPTIRRWPYEYKAGFSPIDVVEEYTRPARVVRQGRIEILPALSEVESLDFPGIGTLEAFVTDGLRTLIRTIPAPDMVEKTLRYPGHADRIRTLRETGFFSDIPVQVGDVRVRPIDLATKLLFPLWQMEEGDEDVTVMRVVVEGESPDGPQRIQTDLFDRFDRSTGTSAMARTTGFAATSAIRLLASGAVDGPGLLPPEALGRREDWVTRLLADLRDRGIEYRETVGPLACGS
ncbi:MAG: saccharopine dehydrogenase C-terminal domain-containing protein [Candidatus Bipolaricaulota bacterium]